MFPKCLSRQRTDFNFILPSYYHNRTETNSENMGQNLIPLEFQLPVEILSYQV